MADQQQDVSSTQKIDGEEIKPYDFRNPRRIQPQQQETLRIIHESYGHALSTSLSSFLRTDVTVHLQSTEQQTFAEYLRALNSPTCVAIFDMQMLTGYGLLEVNSILMYAIVDRLMGGQGKVDKIERPFTQLELAIAKRLFHLLLKDLSKAWEYLLSISFELKDVQTNPAFVRITAEREICLTISLKIQINDISGLITLCLPYSNLEPLAAKLENQESSYVIPQPQEVQQKLLQNLGAVDLELKAILGSIELNMEDVLTLQVGDVLDLAQKARQTIILQVAGENKFRVIPGLVGKFRGITIEQEINKENTL